MSYIIFCHKAPFYPAADDMRTKGLQTKKRRFGRVRAFIIFIGIMIRMRAYVKSLSCQIDYNKNAFCICYIMLVTIMIIIMLAL